MKNIETDRNPSAHVVLHVEFESAVQIGPKSTQGPIFKILLKIVFIGILLVFCYIGILLVFCWPTNNLAH